MMGISCILKERFYTTIKSHLNHSNSSYLKLARGQSIIMSKEEYKRINSYRASLPAREVKYVLLSRKSSSVGGVEE